MKSNIRKIATRAIAIFGMVFLMGLSLFGGAQSVKVTAQENIPATVDTYSPIGTVINLFDYMKALSIFAKQFDINK